MHIYYSIEKENLMPRSESLKFPRWLLSCKVNVKIVTVCHKFILLSQIKIQDIHCFYSLD
jgi:hypothetical protein